MRKATAREIALLRDDIVNTRDTLREIANRHGVSRRVAEYVLNALGIDKDARSIEVKEEKSRRRCLAKIKDMDAFMRDLEDMSLLNHDLCKRHRITPYVLAVVAEILGYNLKERKADTKERRHEVAAEKVIDESWKDQTMSKDGVSTRWLTMKW